jgi:hypothetical protein
MASGTYRECAFSEDNDIHVQRLQICWTIWILIERTETDKVVISEKLNLFTRFLHEDIFDCQRMDTKDLDAKH